MKYKSLFALAAALLMAFACQKPETPETGAISIEPSTLEFSADGEEKSVSLTSNVAWQISGYAAVSSWLEISPANGGASSDAQTISIKAAANDGDERMVTLEFYGKDCSASLTITQGKAEAGTVTPEPDGDIYSISFLSDKGGFTIEDKLKPAELAAVWTQSSQYGMVGTGYADDKNYASESWLISPVIDLSSEPEAYLTFEHATNFFKSLEVVPEEASVWAREEGGDWNPLDGFYYPGSMGWTFYEAGYADLNDYTGKKMQFAFAYKSTEEKAGTWEVKNVAVTRTAPPTEPVSDTPGKWLELPAVGADELFITHDMQLKGATVRNYSYSYSVDDRLAYWVAYPLNRSLRGSGSRSDEWKLDPKLPRDVQSINYRSYGGGYERGHQLPSADRLQKEANEATFYFSNMTPQLADLNGKAWGDLEDMVRDWSNDVDTLYVVTGVDLAGAVETVKDNEGNEVTVPTGYFKALLSYDADAEETYRGIAFYFEHKAYPTGEKTIMELSMSIDALEEKLGYDFFVNLPELIGEEGAAAVESVVDDRW